MLILKYIDLQPSSEQYQQIAESVTATAKQVSGLQLVGIYNSAGKGGVVVVLRAGSLEAYLDWLRLCPPPPGVKAFHEILPAPEEVGWVP